LLGIPKHKECSICNITKEWQEVCSIYNITKEWHEECSIYNIVIMC
jgi:hypothetical protein